MRNQYPSHRYCELFRIGNDKDVLATNNMNPESRKQLQEYMQQENTSYRYLYQLTQKYPRLTLLPTF